MSSVIGARNTAGVGPVIIPAPGVGRRIVIFYIRVQAEADGANLIFLKSGSTIIDRLYCSQSAQGILDRHLSPNTMPSCGENEALYLELSGNLQIGYVIRYEIEAVL
jgi:hypothetical protein